MIAGSPLAGEDISFLEMVEGLGAEIVADATCTGDRWIDFSIAEDENPLDALSDGYFSKPPCIRSRPNDGFYRYAASLGASRKVDAILWRSLRFCDLWAADAKRARRILNYPLLPLDMTFSDRDSPRIKTRIEAFLESLP